MSAAFITPRAVEPLVVDGVTFHVRSLTAEERLYVMLGSELVEDGDGRRMRYSASAFGHAVRKGLVGWEAPEGAPKFSDDPEENIRIMSDTSFSAVGAHILKVSFLSEEQSGN